MLAMEGGSPVRSTFLSYAFQSIDDSDHRVISEVLDSVNLTQGPWIERFEEAIAERCGVDYAVAFSSGTAALHGAVRAAGLGQGDQLLTSPITFVASSNCAFYVGATPAFVDIDPNTYCIDPQKLSMNDDSSTRAIVAVDFTGQPANVRAIRDRVATYSKPPVLIQDAAHSLGAMDQGIPVGQLADMTMFSFHPVKQITTGEGGMIVTNNAEYARILKRFRTHGITRDEDLLTQNPGAYYYEMHELGYHYRMTDIQAALGWSQLKRLDSFLTRRREIVARYNEAFQSLPGIILPQQRVGTESAWHLYILQWENTRFLAGRDELFTAMRAENIGAHVHYIPVYQQPYYRNHGFAGISLPNAEKFYSQCMTIPLFPAMTDQDILHVITAVYKIHEHYFIK